MSDSRFSDATFRFLADLAENNDRTWFEANRDRYEADWKAPALDFIAALSPRLAALDPPLQAEPKLNASLRRINRDVRFSADKSPYNARLHLIFSTGGKFNKDAGMHIVLHPDGVGYGAGLYGFERETLARYRDLVSDPDEAAALARAVERTSAVGARLSEPDLARAPAGFDASGSAADFLRHKSIVVRTVGDDAPRSVLTGPDALGWTVRTTTAFLPLLAWLKRLA